MNELELTKATKEEIESIKEATFGTWLNLNLSEEKIQEITDNILKEIDEIEEERKPFYTKIKQYRNQYKQLVEETSLPFPGCFNLCVPLTIKVVDTCVSQTEEAFEDVDPKWAIMTPPDKNLAVARDMQEKILDYYSDTEMENSDAWGKAYHDAFLLGTGWLCMLFKREFIKIRDFIEYSSLTQFQNDYPDDWQRFPKYVEALAKGDVLKLIIEKNQEIVRSARAEHENWENIYVHTNTKGLEGILKARIIARYVPKRWEEIYIDESKSDFIKGVSEKLKKKTSGKSDVIDPEYLKKVYDTFEVQYFTDVDGDDIEERCLFNIEREHKLCLRAIRYPYNHMHPYVIPYYIQNTEDCIYGIGLGEKLQNLNIVLNAIVSNTLNSATIANAMSLKVRSGSDALRSLYEKQWYPGSIMELINLDDVQQLQFSTPNISGLINLFVLIERFGEDVSGIVNYTSGQESADDPQAPASKAIALMRKAEIKLRRYIKTLKRSNNEAGYQALRLINQYVPKKKIAKILGISENEITDIFQYPLKTITQSSGFAIERMFEKRDNTEMISRLFQDPMIGGDAKRRAVGYRILARDFGSNWDKKIEYLVPTVEELQAQEDKIKQEKDQKKIDVIKQAASKVLEQGGNPEEAREVGLQAGKSYDNMLIQSQEKK